MTPATLPAFDLLTACIRTQARRASAHPALRCAGEALDYGGLDAAMDRVAAALQRAGVRPGERIALCASTSIRYLLVFLGAVRAGVVVVPLAPSAGAQGLRRMVDDCGARLLFADAAGRAALGDAASPGAGTGDADACVGAARLVALDDDGPAAALGRWFAGVHGKPEPVELGPESPFNIIYSSGTTGTPKGIVQSHGMRWGHVRRGVQFGYDTTTVTLLSTPLYSNTTLVALLPTLAAGGTVVLMPRFEAGAWLALAARERATHAMLVPVQYRRLLAHPDFDATDLSSFRMKLSTSAPFDAALKAEVLRRWPGGLTEIYGMTEGGGSCLLEAHRFPDKLHTVGRPAPGHDIRILDEAGRECAAGEAGEVVGHSGAMMLGYHGQPERTREMEWFDATGRRFLRSGDIGRFDADGFLTLLDRRKDMLISGGFNVYPSDLEAVLAAHADVLEAAVVGVPSERWGETPVAFVVARPGTSIDPAALRAWANARLGSVQRLADLRLVGELPRSSIGKVLKRELRAAYGSA